MKKIILTTTIMMFMALTSFAQSNNSEQKADSKKENGKYFYCDVTTDISKVNSVAYDDGTVRGNDLLKDENGKKLNFNTDMSIINYMTLQGWEIYIYNDNGKTVFRKKVTDQEAQELLKKMTR